MTPTPPSPDDDLLDLMGLDLDDKKSKVKTMESDFEKELEALFAEDLTEPVAKAPAPAGAAAEEDILSLEDFAAEPAPGPGATPDEDVLDLSAFAAPQSSPAAPPDGDVLDLADFSVPAATADEDVLDLSAFSPGGELDISPPDDSAGGKDGGIDTAALDDLISGLGEAKPAVPVVLDHPLDETDMSDLLETLDVPRAAPLSKPADDMLDLSLGDLVKGMPAAEPLAESEPAPAAAQPATLEDLDISLPDLSDPEPSALADVDMGGDLNLSLPDLEAGPVATDAELDQFLDAGALDLDGVLEGGMMEGLESSEQAPQAEQSLDPAALLDQIDDGPAAEPAGGLSLGGMALGAAAVGVVGAAAMALHSGPGEPAPAAASASAPIPVAALHEIQEKLAALATQVTGGSVAVVRLEGQIAQKDQAISALEQRLISSREEAIALRRELSDLRAQLEETLRQRAQADEKAATALKERLALVEDRQIQIDRDVRTEIERAVPREAARVIREEIAAMAASMHEE